MMSLDTVRTEKWYSIKWEDAHGNTVNVERPDGEAANYVASLFATPGCTLVNFTEIQV